jgi:hypothetical protein
MELHMGLRAASGNYRRGSWAAAADPVAHGLGASLIGAAVHAAGNGGSTDSIEIGGHVAGEMLVNIAIQYQDNLLCVFAAMCAGKSLMSIPRPVRRWLRAR